MSFLSQEGNIVCTFLKKMEGAGTNLQELALRIARLPRAERLQFIQAVLNLAELGDPAGESQNPARAGGEVEPHPIAVLDLCRQKLARLQVLAGQKGWRHGDTVLLAAVLYTGQQGSWKAPFTAPLLNRVIRELGGNEGRELNVQTLHGLERKSLLARRPDTHPIQFQFTAPGYRRAREVAEKPIQPAPWSGPTYLMSA